METLLIVLLVVFLLGGGGWGYRRWRSKRDHRMSAGPCCLILFAAFDEGSSPLEISPQTLFQVSLN
jgi:hypothetical protein